MKWSVMTCDDCGYFFAILNEPNFQTCPHCNSDDTVGTGEYLSDTLYTENGEEI